MGTGVAVSVSVIAWSYEDGGLLGRVQRRDVPDFCRLVLTAADEPGSVGAEAETGDHS